MNTASATEALVPFTFGGHVPQIGQWCIGCILRQQRCVAVLATLAASIARKPNHIAGIVGNDSDPHALSDACGRQPQKRKSRPDGRLWFEVFDPLERGPET